MKREFNKRLHQAGEYVRISRHGGHDDCHACGVFEDGSTWALMDLLAEVEAAEARARSGQR